MYLLHGKLTAKKGQEEALAKILLRHQNWWQVLPDAGFM